jgi:hypothetical protein
MKLRPAILCSTSRYSAAAAPAHSYLEHVLPLNWADVLEEMEEEEGHSHHYFGVDHQPGRQTLEATKLRHYRCPLKIVELKAMANQYRTDRSPPLDMSHYRIYL